MTERRNSFIHLSPELFTECLQVVQQKPQYLLIPLYCSLGLLFGLIGLYLSSQSSAQKLTQLQLESLQKRVGSIGILLQANNPEIASRLDRLETELSQLYQKLDLIQAMQTGLSEKYQTQLYSPEIMTSMETAETDG